MRATDRNSCRRNGTEWNGTERLVGGKKKREKRAEGNFRRIPRDGKERKGEIGEGGGKWRIVGRAPRGLKRNFVDGLCDA